jgi:hypothetical protein
MLSSRSVQSGASISVMISPRLRKRTRRPWSLVIAKMSTACDCGIDSAHEHFWHPLRRADQDREGRIIGLERTRLQCTRSEAIDPKRTGGDRRGYFLL